MVYFEVLAVNAQTSDSMTTIHYLSRLLDAIVTKTVNLIKVEIMVRLY